MAQLCNWQRDVRESGQFRRSQCNDSHVLETGENQGDTLTANKVISCRFDPFVYMKET